MILLQVARVVEVANELDRVDGVARIIRVANRVDIHRVIDFS